MEETENVFVIEDAESFCSSIHAAEKFYESKKDHTLPFVDSSASTNIIEERSAL
ncbi:MAG: hypothetical protein JRC86_11535 [Deltaproteobacteria bacterium]|nr:hypothetical protein [Deltaproteobacteria bacterium]